MLKKIILISFIVLILVGVFYPSNKENTKILEYCFSFEKILSRNSIKMRKNVNHNLKGFSENITRFGVNRTRGLVINKIINQYKASKNSTFFKVLPNQSYCLLGYWIETVKPGTLEFIFINQSKNKIKQFRDIKDEVDIFFKDINSEYKIIKKEFNNLF